MAVDQKILREYLIALGIKIDERGSKKIDGFLQKTDLRVLTLGKGLVGLATTVVATTTLFARQMEKLYYSARYADTTASSLQALEYGTRQIGLEAGRGAGALKNLAASIRSNPGLIALLNNLGVEVKGRDKADVLTDLVGALKKMPFYIAERYANLFGIDQETLFYLEEGLDKMKQAQAERKKMAEEMGVDVNHSAEIGVQYSQLWREVTERAKLFGMALGETALPYVEALVGRTNELMISWASIARDARTVGGREDLKTRLLEGITGRASGGGVRLSRDARDRLGLPVAADMKSRVATDADAVDAATDNSDFQDKHPNMSEAERIRLLQLRLRGAASDAGDLSPGGVDQPGFDPDAYLEGLERKHGLPRGLLKRVWGRESHFGDPRFMRSPAGAMGHFGFMPGTAKEYGLKDPDDFMESGDAAARKWSDLLRRYGGNIRMAAAAYNWGDGNLARYGLGNAPKETRDYMDAVAGSVMVQANPTIQIIGVTDPHEAADRVVASQRTVNADIVRNMSPKVR